MTELKQVPKVFLALMTAMMCVLGAAAQEAYAVFTSSDST